MFDGEHISQLLPPKPMQGWPISFNNNIYSFSSHIDSQK